MAKTFGDYRKTITGRYTNMDNAYGNQCWDLIAHMSAFFGLARINTAGSGAYAGYAGSMYTAFPQSSAIAADYVKLPASTKVQGGDILVWDNSNKAWFPWTHTAIGIEDRGSNALCLSQNSSGARPDLPGYSNQSTGPTIEQVLPKQGLLGILRPKIFIKASPKPPTVKPAGKIAGSTYKVKAGDTLGEISKRSGVSVANLAKWSGIKNPDRIEVGQTIRLKAPAAPKPAPKPVKRKRLKAIPKGHPKPGEFWVKVSPGNTLSGLAAWQRTTTAKVLKLNPQIDDASKISVGEIIRLK